ncbi:MAG TPA: ATP-binding cassette domain-containing protein [bacterium]|nr:ATP-binding cassette domain-containing protein [bacterium]HPN42522.1 ATP-binding cassette domain-containing protein [bacterium]
MAILKLKQISKAYEEVHAVKELSFSVDKGQIFGLLGPNGAGKTTTIRMIMDIIKPDSGTIEIAGKLNSGQQRDKIGYLPEERGLYKKMKVIDTITFFGEIKSKPARQTQAAAVQWLEKLELLEWRDKKVEELSKGMQQKLQFICTIIHNPELIILDEPFSGLDPVNTNLLKDVMLDLKNTGATIIFSTHLMEQVEKLCENICLINKGASILQGSLKEIKKGFGSNRIRMQYEGAAEFLKDQSLVAQYDDYGQYVEIKPADNVSPQQLLKYAIDRVNVLEFKVSEPSLNEIFIKAVKN